MKRVLIALITLLALVALVAVPAKTTQAGTGAWCVSDPEKIAIGETATIICYGFTPNAHVWAYGVEPDGAAAAIGSFKTDEEGSVAFSFASKVGNVVSAALGTWTIVVDQLGPADTIVKHAEGRVHVTGGTEGVSGAYIWTDADQYTKGDWMTLYGSGFAANEVVTIWADYPNGDCSSTTLHVPPILNFPIGFGISTLLWGNVKADANGDFSFTTTFFDEECEGAYRLVARGNSSWWGDETWVTAVGHSVTESAWMWASKDLVLGLNDTVSFSGQGFGANEVVSCWLRSPQNQVLPVIHIPEIKSDNGGDFSFSIWTGSYFPGFEVASEGALGVYAMTCRGNTSDALAISEFTVTGGTADP